MGREPKYQETAAYGHFGREPYTKNGIKFFEWESAKDLRKYTTMTSANVTAELTASNFLTKWVDRAACTGVSAAVAHDPRWQLRLCAAFFFCVFCGFGLHGATLLSLRSPCVLASALR